MFSYTFTFTPPDPFRFWQSVHKDPTHGFFFGSGASTESDHQIFCSTSEPSRVWRLSHAAKSARWPWHSSDSNSTLPRWVGLISFEAGRLFDSGLSQLPLAKRGPRSPLIEFGDYPSVVSIDLKRNRTVVKSSSRQELERVRLALQHAYLNPGEPSSKRKAKGKISIPARAPFLRMVASAKRSIAAGDIYQANLSSLFRGRTQASPTELYRFLMEKNPSPYSCLLKISDGWIVSCSPELLMRVKADAVSTRPIAGTRPRGRSTKDDRSRRGQLLLSPKERAEHIMLVDLERNDLGRVCRPGTVRVTESCTVEKYSHVMHIVSEVSGALQKGKTWWDALGAVFPGGTITGCPKIKSVEVIQELERMRRGPFYGSVGYVAENGDAVFNILIRTALMQGQRVTWRAGAGIVADSQATKEFREVLAKAKILCEAVRRA